jgi:xylose isomerase
MMNTYLGTYTRSKAAALKAHFFDLPQIAGPGLKYERLDQLTIDLLLGAN